MADQGESGIISTQNPTGQIFALPNAPGPTQAQSAEYYAAHGLDSSGNPVGAATEPTVLSTEQGVTNLNQTKQTLATISGTTPIDTNYQLKPGETNDQYTARIAQYNATKAPTSDTAATKPSGTVKFLNPETGQTQTLDTSNLTPETVNSLKTQGYFSVESNGNVPAWLSTGNLELAQKEAQDAKNLSDINNLKTQLSKFTISDQEIQNTVNSITSQYDARIVDMKKITDAQTAAEKTLGIRLGSQYSGGVMGGIVSEVERQGVQKVADLEAQKQSAISAAKDAARTQNWKVYSQQVDFAEKLYQQSHDEMLALNKTIAENNKKIQENLTQQNKDVAVAGLMKQGITDPLQIVQKLKEQGITATAKDIQDSITNLQPTGIKEIGTVMSDAAKNGAPSATIDAIGKATNVQDAIKAAGEYLQTTSGIVGEYLFYKRQAQAAGQVPVDFNTYQNEDANRKKAIAAAGSANGLSSSTLTKVQSIAGQFDNEQTVKSYQTVAEGKAFLDSIPNETQNPSDQQGAIYAFAKIMDPNSVVREGEYNTVQKYAQSWASTFGFNAERIFSNTPFLSAEALKNMKATIASKVQASENSYKNVYGEYGRRINKITGAKDGTDYITDYSKGYGQTGNNIVQSETQAQDTVKNFITSHADQADSMAKLSEQGFTFSDIVDYLKSKNLLQ